VARDARRQAGGWLALANRNPKACRGDLGNAMFNAWLDVAPETNGLRALPLFLAPRAATRSYALAGGAQRQSNAKQAARPLVLARRHVHASIDFPRPRRPLLIA
jgi:uncharacterized protein